jgi:hypothetical protein
MPRAAAILPLPEGGYAVDLIDAAKEALERLGEIQGNVLDAEIVPEDEDLGIARAGLTFVRFTAEVIPHVPLQGHDAG